MTKQEIKARIAELTKLEAVALAEKDTGMWQCHRGKRNALEEKLSAVG